ncbi:MAG: hypothetical protein DMD86_01205 [Candidatus Rokuibacteriota bacterium]|nr:MAG: hypothetical protein DMD86_01205 [Candidatus Rokubacteria bacterium]
MQARSWRSWRPVLSAAREWTGTWCRWTGSSASGGARSRWPSPAWRPIAWSSSRASSRPPGPSPPWTRGRTCFRPRPTGRRWSRASCSSPTASPPLPILIIAFDDGALSLIQIKQEQKGYEGAAMRHEGPDLAALARSFGLTAFAAADERALRSALVSALATPGPTLIDARIDPSGYRRMLEIVRGVPSG